ELRELAGGLVVAPLTVERVGLGERLRPRRRRERQAEQDGVEPGGAPHAACPHGRRPSPSHALASSIPSAKPSGHWNALRQTSRWSAARLTARSLRRISSRYSAVTSSDEATDRTKAPPVARASSLSRS